MALKIRTPLTDLLGIDHPVMLAGMGNVSGSGLAAAVSNAGGFGCIGGVFMSPDTMREDIDELREQLKNKEAPFGVDLLLPKVGGGARKTNKDYTKGSLMTLADVMIEKKCKVFVCAVGTAPRHFVDKLHSAGILYMNMVGHVKHVKKALAAGADMICAQGGEGGGHTGDTPFSVLIPSVVDACKGKLSPVTGKPVVVVAAGGVYDGRGLAMALAAGAAVCGSELGSWRARTQARVRTTKSSFARRTTMTLAAPSSTRDARCGFTAPRSWTLGKKIAKWRSRNTRAKASSLSHTGWRVSVWTRCLMTPRKWTGSRADRG